jgi:HEAT repeat protein
MTASAPSPEPAKRSRRMYILWSIALTLLLSTALFCWLVVRPHVESYYQVRRAIDNMEGKPVFSGADEAVQELGGNGEALVKLRRYLRIPGIDPDQKDEAARCLGRCGPSAIPDLIVLLDIRSDDVTSYSTSTEAVMALSRMGAAAVPDLVRTLEEGPDRRRYPAIIVLDALGSAARPAIPALEVLAKSDTTRVRKAAVRAIISIKAARE